MKTTEKPNHEVHRNARMLLPWYVNNTLARDEKSLVEKHLKVCLYCRAELVEQKKLARMVSGADPIASKASLSFVELQRRIQATRPDPLRRAARFAGFRRCIAALGRPLSGSPVRVLAPAFSVLAGVGMLVFSGYLAFSDEPAAQFQTLSSSREAPLGKYEIRIVFEEGVGETQIMKILDAVDGAIVSGPNKLGVYVIRIGTERSEVEDVSRIVEKLRAQDAVLFAEPALSALIQKTSG